MFYSERKMTMYKDDFPTEFHSAGHWNPKQKFHWMIMLYLSCAALYATRMAMPITITEISQQLGWKKTTAGTVLSCFFWGYALTQVLGGYLGDCWGGEKVLLVSAIGWAVITLYTPEMTVANIWMLLLSRILLGAFQGVHFPAMSSILSKNIKQQERTFFNSIVSAGPSTGLLLMGSCGSLVQEYYGWPTVFKITGILALSWCLGITLLMKNAPKCSKHPSANPVVDQTVPWICYFRSPAFWVILLSHFTENNSFFILISWLPTYFHDKFPEAKSWIFNMVPWLITPICTVIGGTLADHLIRKGCPVATVRKLLEVLCQLTKAILLPLVPYSGFVAALIWMTLSVASSGFHYSGVFINPQDIAPHHAGSVFGLMNTVGAIPGFIGVYAAGYIVEVTKSWALVFYLTSVLNIIGCVFFVVFGRGVPIVS